MKMDVPSFEIHSVDNDGKLFVVGAIPRGLTGYDGCHFDASLVSTALSASVRVYDIQPQNWTAFFNDLAEDWKGWSGEKRMESLEGHLAVSATSDSLGHISLRVKLRDIIPGTADWRAEGTLIVEAGQLERLASDAKRFFG
jgi:Family of unknown function (DUF6228)